MKKIYIITFLAITSLGILTGCITAANPTGQVAVVGVNIDPIATGNAIRIAAKLGSLATIQKNPDTRVYFQVSANAIAAAIATGNYDPANLQASIDLVSGNKAVSMSIADALSIYQDFFGKVVNQKLNSQSPYTIPVLTGLAAGIQDAINLSQPIK